MLDEKEMKEIRADAKKAIRKIKLLSEEDKLVLTGIAMAFVMKGKAESA